MEYFEMNEFELYNDFQGRLSKDEIERMVAEAEKYKADDEKQKDRISAKNALESYAFNIKQTIEDEKLKDKISVSLEEIEERWISENFKMKRWNGRNS